MNSLNRIINVRQTFGIVNPLTGETYSDIIDSHLTVRQLTLHHLIPNSILCSHIKGEEGEFYLLHMDSKLKDKLRKETIVLCIISMQKRTYGNIAEARIYKEQKNLKKERE